MSNNSKFICQVYEWKNLTDAKQPILTKTQMFECRDARDAENRAIKIHNGKQYAGVDVFKVRIDEDLGEYDEPEFIARLGDVPNLDA
jgi:hypothetical protein